MEDGRRGAGENDWGKGSGCGGCGADLWNKFDKEAKDRRLRDR
jgi:hypothetical protein